MRETEYECICVRVCEREIKKQKSKTEKERIDSDYLTGLES